MAYIALLREECASPTRADVVRVLLQAGADVNAYGGVTRATAPHMAARRGYVEIARALIDSGAVASGTSRCNCAPKSISVTALVREVSQIHGVLSLRDNDNQFHESGSFV